MTETLLYDALMDILKSDTTHYLDGLESKEKMLELLEAIPENERRQIIGQQSLSYNEWSTITISDIFHDEKYYMIVFEVQELQEPDESKPANQYLSFYGMWVPGYLGKHAGWMIKNVSISLMWPYSMEELIKERMLELND